MKPLMAIALSDECTRATSLEILACLAMPHCTNACPPAFQEKAKIKEKHDFWSSKIWRVKLNLVYS
jgi:hypothetical protein